MNNPFDIIQSQINELKSLLHHHIRDKDQQRRTSHYSPAEIAKFYNKTPQTIRSYCSRGILKSVRIGRSYQIKHTTIFDENDNLIPLNRLK
ncbi:hypothetical protein MED134_15094 [Dokdonia sp. MED134]|uniref:helix-turn-helix domain-containing protein n=1 Tax=Dokdonia sp. MED134 TaxID=313590 RepID=UPI000068ABE8|nr:hypothetical protein MED134_15094 [Dokdonia sp. MED134]